MHESALRLPADFTATRATPEGMERRPRRIFRWLKIMLRAAEAQLTSVRTQGQSRNSFKTETPCNHIHASSSACCTSTRVHSLTSPSPVQSTQSMIFGRPQLVTCKPAAAGSTPVSKIATHTPRPSQDGRVRRKAEACGRGGGGGRGQWE